MGATELQIFVSLVVVLGAAFVALICDFLKGSNERLREANLELQVRRDHLAASGSKQPRKPKALKRTPEAASARPASATGADESVLGSTAGIPDLVDERDLQTAALEALAREIAQQRRSSVPALLPLLEAPTLVPAEVVLFDCTSGQGPEASMACRPAVAEAASTSVTRLGSGAEGIAEPISDLSALGEGILSWEVEPGDAPEARRDAGEPEAFPGDEPGFARQIAIGVLAPARMEGNRRVHSSALAMETSHLIGSAPAQLRTEVRELEPRPEGLRRELPSLPLTGRTCARSLGERPIEAPRNRVVIPASQVSVRIDMAWGEPGQLLPAALLAAPPARFPIVSAPAAPEREDSVPWLDLPLDASSPMLTLEDGSPEPEEEAPVVRIRVLRDEPVNEPQRDFPDLQAIFASGEEECVPAGHLEEPLAALPVPFEHRQVSDPTPEASSPVEPLIPRAADFPRDNLVELPVAVAPEPAIAHELINSQPIPAGWHEMGVLEGLAAAGASFNGLILSIAINDFEKLLEESGAQRFEEAAAELADSLGALAGRDDFLCRAGTGEFMVLFPGLAESEHGTRVRLLTEILWDFQLRSASSVPMMCTWGQAKAAGEPLAGALDRARQQVHESLRSRRGGPSLIARFRRRVVNG